MKNDFFLTRADYDKVLAADNELISFMTQQLRHYWNFAGVMFQDVSKENQEKISAILAN